MRHTLHQLAVLGYAPVYLRKDNRLGNSPDMNYHKVGNNIIRFQACCVCKTVQGRLVSQSRPVPQAHTEAKRCFLQRRLQVIKTLGEDNGQGAAPASVQPSMQYVLN